MGSIEYVLLRSDITEDINKPLNIIKSRWENLKPSKIYLAKIVCGSHFIALVQTYDRPTHGSVLVTSYGFSNPMYAWKDANGWHDTTLVTNTDLNPEVYIVPKPSNNSVFTFSNTFQVSVRKSGKVVTIQLNISASMAAAGDFVTAFTIPQKYKPLTDVVINYIVQNTNKSMVLFITRDGEVKFSNLNSAIDDWLCRQCVTYVTN